MEELGLNFDNILDDDEISTLLFDENAQDISDEDNKDSLSDETEEDSNNDNSTAEVDSEDLFDDSDEKPESVGGKKDKQGEEEDTTKQKSGASPNFFSSVATAFAEEGIFPDLDEETINGINDAQSFRDAIDQQIEARLTEQQKRVLEVLDNGVEPDVIRQYEHLLGWLDAQEGNLEVEGDAGDDLRRKIILQDYINKGFEEKRARSKVDKIFEEGGEIEEAKESLQSLKAFYSNNYTKLRNEAKAEAEREIEERKKKADRIRKTIIEDKTKLFGDIEISKSMRQNAFDAISKPIYKDPKTGETYTAIQKLELDNSEDFLAKLGLLYALTDGFTSIDKLVNKKVRKEVKKGFSELERKINNTAIDSYGNLNFASGVSDENSFIGKGIKLDI